VQHAYGVNFDYQHSCQIDELPRRLRPRGEGPFDVVIFAGVLYHMIDPLGGLALARSFLRQNGLLLLETSAVVSSQPVLYLNAEGRFFPGSNYFQVTLGTLDYLLRALRLRVIDCHYTKGARLPAGGRWLNRFGLRFGKRLCRVSVVCRAVDEPLPAAGDEWMTKPFIAKDLAARQLDFATLNSPAPPVAYQPGKNPLRHHRGIDAVDLYRSVVRGRRFMPSDALTVLRLADQSERRSSRERAA
jgi:hypothetical protein